MNLVGPTKQSNFSCFLATDGRRCLQRNLYRPRAAAQVQESVRATITRKIKMLGRAGRAREAVEQLAEMAKLGVQPDKLAATALLDACARCGKLEMMQAVFEELFVNEDILVPDDVAFAVMIRGYGSRKPPNWPAIHDILNKMTAQYSMLPSIAVFNEVFEICVRMNDEERTAEFLSRMEAAGIEPNRRTNETLAKRRALRTLLRRTFGS